jgi:hypothetical protein
VTHRLWVDCMASVYGHGSEGRGRGWAGLRQVVHIRTTREAVEPGLPILVEDHYYLTSLPPDTPRGRPEALLVLARRHWEIENCLHHAKDRSLYEDADRTKRGSAVMSRLRSVAVALLQCVAGASVPQKQLRIAAKPAIALALLWRRRLAGQPR